MRMINRRAAALAASLAALVLAAAPAVAQAPAQAWPQRPVKFILTLGPGSGADIGARLFADKLSARWGQPVVVENRPGGDGIVAITGFVGARDDHTLLFAPTSTFTGHPYLQDKVPYDQADLAPVARVTNTLITISAPASLNVKSLKELIALARAKPGELNWTSVTGLTDLVIAAYFKNAGIQMTKIPYRDTVQALNDVIEGRLHFYWSSYAIARPQAQAGKIKILVVNNSERALQEPDIPTAREEGFPELTFDGLIGLFGPRSMPAELRERIAADVREAAADPTIAARLTATGQVVNPGTAAEFAAAIEEQRLQAAAVAKTLGITPKQ